MTTFKFFTQKKAVSLVITLAFLTGFLTSHAQSRNYSIVYSDNIKGGSAIFGNTLMQIIDHDSVNTTKMNDNSADGNSMYGNNKENMQYADIDGNTGYGSVTRNSSSADLVLPAGTNTIKIARLYWGGFVINSQFDLLSAVNKKIKIRKGTSGSYADVTASGIDKAAISAASTQYQAYADITDFVQNNGTGTYEIGNVPLSTGSLSVSGANGGWYIVVVYENQDLNYSSIRFYDGFEKLYTIGNMPSTKEVLTGLNVPSGILKAGDAKMGVVAWEGDANLKTDFLKINGNLFFNAANPINNPWNGTITNNGEQVTTKNPNFTNQFGLDIDQFDVGSGYGISPGDSSVTLQFGAEADRYFPGAFTFSIKVKVPAITLNKTVSDANNDNLAEANEILTYKLKAKNTGAGNANFVVIADTLPATVTYLPGSLKVITSAGVTGVNKTDIAGDDNAEYVVNGSYKTVMFWPAAGSSGIPGGTLIANDSFEVEFKATVNNPGAGVPVSSIVNIARIRAMSDAGEKFTDDATAIINAEAGPLPISLVSFDGLLLASNKVKLEWATSLEINCSQYKVERSTDGDIFNNVSTVAGNGTSSSMHSYIVTDDVSLTTASIVYYRLKQIDLNNKINYSKIIAVRLKAFHEQISISPNPFSGYLNINVEWGNSERIKAKVINIQGKEVISKEIQMSKGLNYIAIKELAKLAAGDYFIQFISAKQNITKKISKQ